MPIIPRHNWHRLRARAGSLIFAAALVAILGLAYWLSVRHALHFDWTYAQRSSLSSVSRQLLARIDDPIGISAFARDDVARRRQIELLVDRYQRARPGIDLHYVNPDLQPDQARKFGIRAEGELVVHVGERWERVSTPTEQALSNALLRAAGGRRTLVLLNGAGDRAALGNGSFGLGRFLDQLAQQGYQIEQLDPATDPLPPPGAAVVVLVEPTEPMLPGSLRALLDYLDGGGNLLWLGRPRAPDQLLPVAESLGVSFLPGVVFDRSAAVAGFDDPLFAVARSFADHPITAQLRGLAVLPSSAGIDAEPVTGWTTAPLMATVERLSWTETGAVDSGSGYDAASRERPGPIALGVALSRPVGERTQRAVVFGDADFLANSYLGLGANLELGLNALAWLSGDDELVAINPAAAPDTRLPMSGLALSSVGAVFLLAIPLCLWAAGWGIWWWRQRQR